MNILIQINSANSVIVAVLLAPMQPHALHVLQGSIKTLPQVYVLLVQQIVKFAMMELLIISVHLVNLHYCLYNQRKHAMVPVGKTSSKILAKFVNHEIQFV